MNYIHDVIESCFFEVQTECDEIRRRLVWIINNADYVEIHEIHEVIELMVRLEQLRIQLHVIRLMRFIFCLYCFIVLLLIHKIFIFKNEYFKNLKYDILR